MPAYIIFTREKLRDPKAIEDYTAATKDMNEGFNLKPRRAVLIRKARMTGW